MKFPRKSFDEFLSHLVIDSKEKGRMRLSELMGSQRHLIDEIEKGYNLGIRLFVVLKGRQLGITTLSTALDLYWQMRYAGMTGAMVSDDETNRDYFRSLIDQYLRVLPRAWRIPTRSHNRNQLVFRNNSRIQYMVAGFRKKATLGQGKGINFCHGTEVSSWGDPDGFRSLMASLAENHPHRLYIFESTAKGLNHYHDLWRTATRARFMYPIFIGWWRKEEYSFPKDSNEFKTYWDGRLLPEERDWMRDIERLYKYEIRPEQIAWWRYQLFEKFQGDTRMLMQEHAPTADLAFQLTGDQFFASPLIVEMEARVETEPFDGFRYDIGNEFHQLKLKEDAEGELKVWEGPIENATYVIGADPAYGSSEWKDNFAIQVFRCYADGCEQVAEYLTPHCSMTAFAWILAHLGGAYKNALLIMEINGPGKGVLDELNKLPWKMQALDYEKGTGGFVDVIAGIRHYLYQRPDILGGRSNAIHWSMTQALKMQCMNSLKDALMMGWLKMKSSEFVEEARGVVQEGTFIGAEGRGKDDAVIAAALAVEGYKQIQTELAESRRTYDVEHAEVQTHTPLNWIVENYLKEATSEVN